MLVLQHRINFERVIMNAWLKTTLILFLFTFIAACSVIQLNPDNKPVRLLFYNEINMVAKKTPECHYLGTIVSSDGHWYNYLFISNTSLTLGAINDMNNKANKMGANVIYINDNIDFATSVTLLGQAYSCEM